MAIIGIISGLVGTAITGGLNVWKMKEQRLAQKDRFAHDEKRMEHESKMLTLESQAKVSEIEMSAFMEQVKGSFKGLETSIQSQIQSGLKSSKRVNGILTLYRPLLTTALVSGLFWLSFDNLDVVKEIDHIKFAFLTLVDLAAMSSTWWFGDRSMKRNAQTMSLGRNIRGADGEF